jgi:hypothetical protein
MYDNSGARPRLIGKKQDGTVTVDPAAPAALRQALGLVPQGALGRSLGPQGEPKP